MPKNTICIWYDKDAEAAARDLVEGDTPQTTLQLLLALSESGLGGDILKGICYRAIK